MALRQLRLQGGQRLPELTLLALKRAQPLLLACLFLLNLGQSVRDPPRIVRVRGHRGNQAHQRPVAVSRHRKTSERIVTVRIEAGRDQEERWPKSRQRRSDLFLPGTENGAIAAAHRQRYIYDVVMRAAFAGAPRARVERVSVGRGVENLGIILETVLRAIAMVDVEVEDGDAPDVLDARRHHTDSHVVEEAEPHTARVFRVMPWGTH